MQSDWGISKLSELIEIKYGKDHKKLDDGNIPVYGSGGIMRYVDDYLYDGDSILIPRKGTLNNIFYVTDKFWTVDTIFWSKINTDKVIGKYVYYFLKTIDFNNLNVGSAVPSMTSKILNDIEVPLPNLETQKKIANILSTLDDKIELNRKMNQTLEDMAQALFKSWFVDFDPVHSLKNSNGEDLETIASNLGISKEVLELFPSEFEDSELGMIPEGWGVERIENILKRYKAPKRYKKDVLKNYGTTPVFEQGADILLGYHDNVGEFEATVENPMFIFGDHTCIMRLSTIPFSISANVIPLSGLVRNSYWTYYAIYGQQTFQEYRRHWSELVVRKIVLSDVKIADIFEEIIQPLICQIENNIKENSSLMKTRDTLLPKLLSGEVEV